jgi:DNA replication protein DnaC/primosomal protein DnaI
MLVTLPCDCEQSKERQRQEQLRTDREEIARILRDVWDRSNVPPRFAHVSADFDTAAPLFEGRWLYLYGENGRGKTYTACQTAKAYLIRNTMRDRIPTRDGFAHGSMRCRVSFRFVEAQGLLSEVTSSWNKWGMSEEQVKSRWAGVDLLILDDLGKGVPSEWAAETIFDTINGRWKCNQDRGQRKAWETPRLTIITSQYCIDDLAERYRRAGAETLSAMVSRLRGECEEVKLGGGDKRITLQS